MLKVGTQKFIMYSLIFPKLYRTKMIDCIHNMLVIILLKKKSSIYVSLHGSVWYDTNITQTPKSSVILKYIKLDDKVVE